MIAVSKERLRDVVHFYGLLDELERRLSGTRTLETSHGRMKWPQRGVYFFFEPGELRSTTGHGLRAVRIGTHALQQGSNINLWERLRMHKGTARGKYPGGGNHRASIFRKHVGTAFINKQSWSQERIGQWGSGFSTSNELRRMEQPLEKIVSQHIRGMPFLWVEVDDPPGTDSDRGVIECNAIALLSDYPYIGSKHESSECIDPPSKNWLGRYASSEHVARSGLWNANCVDKNYDPEFLDLLKTYIDRM